MESFTVTLRCLTVWVTLCPGRIEMGVRVVPQADVKRGSSLNWETGERKWGARLGQGIDTYRQT
jgi:hypothetical protein